MKEDIKDLNKLIKEYNLDPKETYEVFNNKVDDYITRDLLYNKLCEINVSETYKVYEKRAISVISNYLNREINSEISFRNRLLGVF